MKATEAKLLTFISKSPQFEIPIYQRTYSWTEPECQQLWDDILRVGADDEQMVHFIGSIVYIESGLYQVSTSEPVLVIDGQQRLTTITLLLVALEWALKEWDLGEPFDGFSALKIRNRYLVNPDEDGPRHQKLVLGQTDATALTAVVKGLEPPDDASVRILDNLELFKGLISEHRDRIVDLCRGLAKLVIIDVSLTRGQDNPQLIFESMNSTGKELSQADLIRNFVLMGQEQRFQTHLYEKYWRPMELDFGQSAYQSHFDQFMRHYLTNRTGTIPRIGEVYDSFKKHAIARGTDEQAIESLVTDVRNHARAYCRMAFDQEPDPVLREAFGDLRELKVDVAYPLLLQLYDDYEDGILDSAALVLLVRIIESYVFRRAICSIPTNSLNRTFAEFAEKIDKDNYIESFTAAMLLLPAYRRFPTDREFVRELTTRDFYHLRTRSYAFRRLENHGRKERVGIGEYTIEHILPQNPDMRPEWREALGPDWERIQERWLHTLGNLTLTGYNSEYSDLPFADKRDMEGGFRESPLRLNRGLGQVGAWNEAAIRERAGRLGEMATQVWQPVELPAEVLERYRPVVDPSTTYTIDDHPKLKSEQTAPLFKAFRREVLDLDPVVYEEFKKLYVSYKADTNFVDVVPHIGKLRLAINMRFTDLDDPLGRCTDVTNKGRWGNGDAEFLISSMDDIPYAVMLARQSLDRQMGGEE